MTFEAEASLSIGVPQSELRNVKQQLESTVGAVELGMIDGSSMSAQTAGGAGSGRARRRARRSYRMEITRTELLEDTVTYLEAIEDQAGSGDGGGGSIANEIFNFAVDTGGEAGGAAALTGAAGALTGSAGALTGAAGAHGGAAAALTGAAAALSGAAGGTLSVKKPNWVPLSVKDPGTVGFEKLPGPVPIEVPGEPYPLERPSQPYPVEAVEPLAVESVDPIDVEIAVDVSGARGQGGSGTGSGRDPNPIIDRMRERGEQGEENYGVIGETVGGFWGIAEGAYEIVTGDGQGGSSSQGTGGTRSSNTRSSREVNITVENAPRTDVTVEPSTSDIVDDVVDAVEAEYDDSIGTLKRELEDVEDRLDRIESGIRKSR